MDKIFIFSDLIQFYDTDKSTEYLRVGSTEFMLGNVGGTPLISMNSASNKTTISGKVAMPTIPTSASGLSAGDIWSNSGILTIV